MPSFALAALIADQSRDDQTDRIPRRKREVCLTDLAAGRDDDGWDYLASVPDHRSQPSLIIGVGHVWGAEEVSYHRGRTCPACGDAIQGDRPGPLHFCLVCSASTDDPRQWPPPPPLVRRQARRHEAATDPVPSWSRDFAIA